MLFVPFSLNAATEGAILGWSPDLLTGAVLQLVSGTKVERLRFGKGGVVTITAGQRGGPVTGLLAEWSVGSNGNLNIGHPDNYDSLKYISSFGNRITAKRRSGAIVEFELSHQ